MIKLMRTAYVYTCYLLSLPFMIGVGLILSIFFAIKQMMLYKFRISIGLVDFCDTWMWIFKGFKIGHAANKMWIEYGTTYGHAEIFECLAALMSEEEAP